MIKEDVVLGFLLAHLASPVGEAQAAERLGQAAETMSTNPGAMQLRTLQTMAEIATERNSTIIFPIPVEIISIFRGLAERFGPTGS